MATAERMAAHAMSPGDIVYGRRGDIGRRAIIREKEAGWICGTGCLRISIGDKVLDPKYLYYYLGASDVVAKIAGQAIGATMPNLNTSILRAVEVTYPPLPTQRRIADILSAYDDLIENNTRRIAILEDMARSLYREWFVNFRFPGHENVEMMESELGPIPEGWRCLPFSSLLKSNIGGGWGKDESTGKHVLPAAVIRGTDIPGARYLSLEKVPLRYHTASNLRSRILTEDDIIMEVSGGSKDQPVGRTLLVSPELLRSFDEPLICASFCKRLVVDPQVLSPLLAQLHLLELYSSGRIAEYEVQSTGIKNLRFAVFLEKELAVCPVADLQEEFLELVRPMMAGIQNLSARNRVLRNTRDLLLPKLISGELRVEAVEPVEEMVAAGS